MSIKKEDLTIAIYSALTSDQIFTLKVKTKLTDQKTTAQQFTVKESVLIKGVLNESDPETRGEPYGKTMVSKEQKKMLESNITFIDMKESGFLSFSKFKNEEIKKDKSSIINEEELLEKNKSIKKYKGADEEEKV